MDHYRLYFMTSCGLHIDAFEAIEADGDIAALELAERYRGRYPIELWWRGRKVGSFTAAAKV